MLAKSKKIRRKKKTEDEKGEGPEKGRKLKLQV
jgi:hypothetical protein